MSVKGEALNVLSNLLIAMGLMVLLWAFINKSPHPGDVGFGLGLILGAIFNEIKRRN